MEKSIVHDLITANIHFGERASDWNPKMCPYIFGERNGIHIINIKETVKGLLLAKKFLTSVVASGQDVCFVGTKRHAKRVIEQRAGDVGMHFVVERWLGGTLTNFRTIRERLKRLSELEAMAEKDNFQNYSKKMESQLRRELKKIKRNLDGIRKMERLPGALVIVDVKREINSIREARKLGIKTVALIDTDGDPDMIDIPIPGNDDSLRSIDVVMRELCESIAEGKQARPVAQADVAGATGESDDQRRRRRRRAKVRPDDASAVAETRGATPLSNEALLHRLSDWHGGDLPPVSIFVALDEGRDDAVLTRRQRTSVAIGVARLTSAAQEAPYNESVDVQFFPRPSEGVEWAEGSDGMGVRLRLEPHEHHRVSRLSFVPLQEGELLLDIEVFQSFRRLEVLSVRATVVVSADEPANVWSGRSGPR